MYNQKQALSHFGMICNVDVLSKIWFSYILVAGGAPQSHCSDALQQHYRLVENRHPLKMGLRFLKFLFQICNLLHSPRTECANAKLRLCLTIPLRSPPTPVTPPPTPVTPPPIAKTPARTRTGPIPDAHAKRRPASSALRSPVLELESPWTTLRDRARPPPNLPTEITKAVSVKNCVSMTNV